MLGLRELRTGVPESSSVMTLPPSWDGYPDHKHDADVADANQEEVYISLAGSGTLHADGESFVLPWG